MLTITIETDIHLLCLESNNLGYKVTLHSYEDARVKRLEAEQFTALGEAYTYFNNLSNHYKLVKWG